MNKSALKHLFDRDNVAAGETIFHELAKYGALGVLYQIYTRTTEAFDDLLQIKNYEGELCTHVAAKYHNGSLAIQLIEVLELMGADLNGRNSCAGETILHGTVYDGDYELAEWLCKRPQINSDARNYARLTAYQIACKRDDEQMKEIFRKAGADCEEPEETSSEVSDGEE